MKLTKKEWFVACLPAILFFVVLSWARWLPRLPEATQEQTVNIDNTTVADWIYQEPVNNNIEGDNMADVTISGDFLEVTVSGHSELNGDYVRVFTSFLSDQDIWLDGKGNALSFEMGTEIYAYNAEGLITDSGISFNNGSGTKSITLPASYNATGAGSGNVNGDYAFGYRAYGYYYWFNATGIMLQHNKVDTGRLFDSEDVLYLNSSDSAEGAWSVSEGDSPAPTVTAITGGGSSDLKIVIRNGQKYAVAEEEP